LITSTLVSVLFGLNVLLPLRFERVQGWPTPLTMPGEPQLSGTEASSGVVHDHRAAERVAAVARHHVDAHAALAHFAESAPVT
jgi:hypothetical protein